MVSTLQRCRESHELSRFAAHVVELGTDGPAAIGLVLLAWFGHSRVEGVLRHRNTVWAALTHHRAKSPSYPSPLRDAVTARSRDPADRLAPVYPPSRDSRVQHPPHRKEARLWLVRPVPTPPSSPGTDNAARVWHVAALPVATTARGAARYPAAAGHR